MDQGKKCKIIPPHFLLLRCSHDGNSSRPQWGHLHARWFWNNCSDGQRITWTQCCNALVDRRQQRYQLMGSLANQLWVIFCLQLGSCLYFFSDRIFPLSGGLLQKAGCRMPEEKSWGVVGHSHRKLSSKEFNALDSGHQPCHHIPRNVPKKPPVISVDFSRFFTGDEPWLVWGNKWAQRVTFTSKLAARIAWKIPHFHESMLFPVGLLVNCHSHSCYSEMMSISDCEAMQPPAWNSVRTCRRTT